MAVTYNFSGRQGRGGGGGGGFQGKKIFFSYQDELYGCTPQYIRTSKFECLLLCLAICLLDYLRCIASLRNHIE